MDIAIIVVKYRSEKPGVVISRCVFERHAIGCVPRIAASVQHLSIVKRKTVDNLAYDALQNMILLNRKFTMHGYTGTCIVIHWSFLTLDLLENV